MSWKNFTKDYLTFSKKDRIGIIIFLILITVIYFLPYLFAGSSAGSSIKTDSAILRAIDTLNSNIPNAYTYKGMAKEKIKAKNNVYAHEPGSNNSFLKGELFIFDPNTLPAEGWQRLGLKEKTSKTIENYRNKGGKFRKPEDIKKIWDLPEGFYERVKDYIQITSAPVSINKTTPVTTNYPKPEKEERKITVTNINAADTSALIALPGIGSKLASRIVNFRNKLGGFYSVEQLGETYGLPDSTFQRLKPLLKIKTGEIKKININTAGKDELKSHPYIKWNLANAIVEYRNQHGSFSSIDDLKRIVIIEDAILEKLRPYLTVE